MSELVCAECSRTLPADAPELLCPYCLLAIDDLDPQAQEETVALRGRFQPPEPAELQQHFDPEQLEILQLIGSGGMGAVYHARQPRLMRDVALKVLPPELAASPGFDDRFAREARVLARLDHANVVDVHDFGKAGPYSYLMLEYVDGVNLRDLMSGGAMNPSDGFEIVPQICDALQYAHDQGIVHRDIKPENILVDSNGRVKITDFGLAKLARPDAAERDLTGTHQVMGTPNYMAPEQIEKPREVDHRADIYALGVVFYELLTGELPLGRFDPPSRKGNGSRRLDKVVMKTLAKEPERRYDQASDVKSDVEKAVGNDSAQAAVVDYAAEFVSAMKRTGQSGSKWIGQLLSKHRVLAMLGFFLLVLATYLVFFMAFLALGGAILLVPLLLAGGCGLSLLVEHYSARIDPPRLVKAAAFPLIWVSGWLKQLPAVADRDWRAMFARSHLDRDSIPALIVLACWLMASFFLLMTMSVDDDLFPGVIIFLIAGYALARFQLAKLSIDELSTWKRWCFYPPIVILLTMIALPALFAPGVATAVILIESSRDLNQFIEGVDGQPSLTVISFGIAVVLLIQMLWIAALMLLARWTRRVVRKITFPFLRNWDGAWTITGSLACFAGAVVFGIVAWACAMA
jgi:hypothetical protein